MRRSIVHAGYVLFVNGLEVVSSLLVVQGASASAHVMSVSSGTLPEPSVISNDAAASYPADDDPEFHEEEEIYKATGSANWLTPFPRLAEIAVGNPHEIHKHCHHVAVPLAR